MHGAKCVPIYVQVPIAVGTCTNIFYRKTNAVCLISNISIHICRVYLYSITRILFTTVLHNG